MPVLKSVPRTRGKAKIKISEKRKQVKSMLEKMKSEDLDVTLTLIQELIPNGLLAAKEEMEKEVRKLTGKRYKHGKENVSWGSQAGSIYLRDQKIPIDVPRVRNKNQKKEVSLDTYQKLQEPYKADKQTMLKLLCGISMHKYAKCAKLVPEVFGISASNLSKRFKQSTAAKVRRLKTRSLSLDDFICIFIDGKRYAKDGLLVALGITISGAKVILDIEHSHSENGLVVEQMLDRLVRRGLKYEDGLLFVVDGSKGLIKGIKNTFKEYAFIQRCQWHKRENIISYLDKAQKEVYKRRLRLAYQKTTYKEASESLELIYRQLIKTNLSAAGSLKEGLEETLTLHKLGLSSELKKSFNTTNCIESVMSQLAQYTDKVDRWRNSYQLIRWTAASLLEIEPMLKTVSNAKYLNVLRFKLKQEIKKRQDIKYGKPIEDEIMELMLI
ncbi:MAG: transposase [Candidatus Levyibacteriota bacterium]